VAHNARLQTRTDPWGLSKKIDTKNYNTCVYFFGAVLSVLLAHDGLPGEEWAGAVAAAAALALALSFRCAMLRALHLRPSGLSNFVVMVAAW